MATKKSALTGLEPRSFWGHFETLTKIARPSRHEEPVIEHVRAWADKHGFELQQDAGRNLVIRVPATPGREAAPIVTLQGHLDMVCERDASSPNDPAEGRIVLVRDGEWLTADGTTLGADDGVAIAAMMALVEDESLPHGPLELLMTVAEEVGLEGANALDPALVTGSVLVNLDSEEDGRLTVGCAGSTDTWIRIRAPREQRGGRPGHARRHRQRRQRRPLRHRDRARPVERGQGARARAARGGRDCRRSGSSRSRAARAATRFRATRSRSAPFRPTRNAPSVTRSQPAAATIRDAYIKTDPGIAVDIEPADAQELPWTEEGTKTLLDAVALVPTGPLALSPDFDDLVETSTSLGEAITEGDELTLHSLSRSSNDSAMPEVIATLDAAARLGGGELEVKKNYGGWRPDLDSKALAAARGAYEREFGEPPIITAVHAGLETAVIGTKVPGLDMLSFGPQIEFPHSPDERVSIPTVERFWKLLVVFLDEMSDPGK